MASIQAETSRMYIPPDRGADLFDRLRDSLSKAASMHEKTGTIESGFQHTCFYKRPLWGRPGRRQLLGDLLDMRLGEAPHEYDYTSICVNVPRGVVVIARSEGEFMLTAGMWGPTTQRGFEGRAALPLADTSLQEVERRAKRHSRFNFLRRIIPLGSK